MIDIEYIYYTIVYLIITIPLCTEYIVYLYVYHLCIRNTTVADPRPTEEDAAEDHAELVQLHERWEKVQRWIRDGRRLES